jgi:biotin carboxyl carrier protein
MTENNFLYHLLVNERTEFDMNGKETEDIDVIPNGPNQYHLIHNNKSYKIELKELDEDRGFAQLLVNGTLHSISIETPLQRKIKALGINEINAADGEEIKAPMPGKVLSILVEEGEWIEAGQDLLILEAMKMENVIKSSQPGQIENIHVKADEAVDKNQKLLDTTTAGSEDRE